MELEDFNWTQIITPINVRALRQLLIQSNYPLTETDFLIEGFTNGFDVGYAGPTDRQDESKNIPLKVGTQSEMWNKIMKEVQLNRMSGPYTRDKLPFKSYIQSPIGLVPKSGGKTRLIFHLSFDFEDTGNRSVNHHTPDHLCTVKYNDLDMAIKQCIQVVKETGLTQLFYSKSDCSSAFRLLPVKISQRCWLLMKMKHPVTKVIYFFIEKCLPFGASISCALFQRFSNCLHHLVDWKIVIVLQIPPAVTNYLDDFLFIAITAILCNGMMKIFLDICMVINCPINQDKTEWATQLIIFLGILLNGRTLTLSVPEDKKIKALHLVQQAITNKKATVKFIQKLTGSLNFLNRTITAGCTFTRGIYQKLKLTNAEGILLKQHHHVNLNKDFILDCKVWKNFLQTEDLRICRPFMDIFDKTGKMINFSSDAAKKVGLGMGAVLNNNWMFAQWSEKFIKQCDPSIEFLELFALTAGILTWSNYKELPLRNDRVTVFCDNQAVVAMVNNLASSCYQCRKLIRLIALCSIKRNLKIYVRYIPSKQNWLSDAISRMDFLRFHALAPKGMKKMPDKVLPGLLPPEKIWNDDSDYLKLI